MHTIAGFRLVAAPAGAGFDPGIVEVRVLSPVDPAVSKLARFGDADRDDIEILAPSIELASNLVAAVQRRSGRR